MQPKLLMARAAAPMFKGLRVATSTTRRWSMKDGEFMSGYSKTTWGRQVSEDADEGGGESARTQSCARKNELAIWRASD